MAIIELKVNPPEPGDVEVGIYVYDITQEDYRATFTASKDEPLDEKLEVPDAHYAVTLYWDSGYHNLTGGPDGSADWQSGNILSYNGKSIFFQVAGAAGGPGHDLLSTLQLS